ncbi:uncharacterized protein LOC117513977 [Thalassophryne amazonica]|uniref:uncharacterized protein LOC117513977 n=1 Tax=Thalassophryne amazonica TaxID=390379 RepID=UPI001470B5D8|nr:uncharacterized protein LOC117513977 [Thalassophryne amazonica]
MAANYEQVCLWKRERLQQFLRERGLPVTGTVEELRVLVYGAQFFSIPVKPAAKEENQLRTDHYRSLLTVDGVVLPDPFTDLPHGWQGEEKGIHHWPPCMFYDMSEYLISRVERDLQTRLLTDYKEGKAYSYFDSKWLKEVYYHPISDNSVYCFLKADYTPSMNIRSLPHRVWVCIIKKTGKVVSSYCTCFAGLGSTCNHVAAVLFKLDYAWQNGHTNKACSSLPAQSIVPTNGKKIVELKKINDMEWRKPNYNKQVKTATINPVERQKFCPVKKEAYTPTLEGLMGAIHLSCPRASVFEYAAADTTASYPVEHDINVEMEVETTTTAPPMKVYVQCHGGLSTFTLERGCNIYLHRLHPSSNAANPTQIKQ